MSRVCCRLMGLVPLLVVALQAPVGGVPVGPPAVAAFGTISCDVEEPERGPRCCARNCQARDVLELLVRSLGSLPVCSQGPMSQCSRGPRNASKVHSAGLQRCKRLRRSDLEGADLKAGGSIAQRACQGKRTPRGRALLTTEPVLQANAK